MKSVLREEIKFVQELITFLIPKQKSTKNMLVTNPTFDHEVYLLIKK